MAAALALGERGRGQTAPNPNVGCIVVRDGIVVGRGWTQPGGRPHAEAMALDEAGDAARGATAYVTLEPCAHESPRGPACAASLVAARVARVVAAIADPDPRTNGTGLAALGAAGIAVESGILADAARRSMAGFLTRLALGRPHVTLKLAMSLDGAIAMHDGRSQWITGTEARVHTHLERARSDTIIVGRGTLDRDRPRLDVRIAGLADRSPRRVLLSARADETPQGWLRVGAPAGLPGLPGDHAFVEGGAQVAASFLREDLVDRLLLYRAPILIGGGIGLKDFGLADLAGAHGRWNVVDTRMLGSDRLEVYERVRD